jgi:hypothetical protein
MRRKDKEIKDIIAIEDIESKRKTFDIIMQALSCSLLTLPNLIIALGWWLMVY